MASLEPYEQMTRALPRPSVLNWQGSAYLLGASGPVIRMDGSPPVQLWVRDDILWAHEHGKDNFVHASAKQGRKIRCSGMFVVQHGQATVITNQSGHYAPTAQSIYHFVSWLQGRNCLSPAARVLMEHDPDGTNGTFSATDFLKWGHSKFGPAAPATYNG